MTVIKSSPTGSLTGEWIDSARALLDEEEGGDIVSAALVLVIAQGDGSAAVKSRTMQGMSDGGKALREALFITLMGVDRNKAGSLS